jgi:protein-S-isoprenylcysteine O-methyltransferase Ste14
MTPLAAKIIWFLGCVAWYVIRYPHQRRSRKTPISQRAQVSRDRVLLAISFTGLFIIPLFYVVTGEPRFADYRFQPMLAVIGTLLCAATMWLFYRVHRELGRSWSVTLEIRDQHALVTHGLYKHVRHPMYTAFWMWGLSQLLLLPNWVAGLAGIVGFGTLYFCRIGPEEQLMLDVFGDDYRAYMERTKKIIPRVY